MTGQSKYPNPNDSRSTALDRANADGQLPLWVELVILGGIALGTYVAPTVGRFVGDKVNVVRVKVGSACESVRIVVHEKWVPIKRKLKKGSLIRVIANILPDHCFNSPCRMFVSSGVFHLEKEQHRFGHLTGTGDTHTFGGLGLTFRDEYGIDEDPNENGLIVAFQLTEDSTENCTETGDVEDTSSNPEGWDPIFHTPGVNNTRFACSTPQPPHGASINPYLNDSFSTQNSDGDKHDVKEELADLRNMVKELLSQMGTFTQNRTINSNYTSNNIIDASTYQHHYLSAFDHKTVNSTPEIHDAPTFTPPSPLVGYVPPPPPPPPPPPMPQMLLSGSRPLIKTIKKTTNGQPKKTGGTLSINLKDIKGVQLRPTPKSPGGTPLKNRSSDGNGELKHILKKRFAAWHSPPSSGRDSEEKENQEENAFDDSFSEDEIPIILKSKSCKKLSSKQNSSRLSDGNRVPFGQHLLKKQNQNNSSEMQSRNSRVLGEQN